MTKVYNKEHDDGRKDHYGNIFPSAHYRAGEVEGLNLAIKTIIEITSLVSEV